MPDSTSVDATFLPPNLSLVLERITDGFFALDSEWRIAYMNAEARNLLHAREDATGTFWLDAFPKARGRLFEREYRRAMREQMPVQFVEYSKTSECWFEVKAYPSADGLSVYFRDVTTRVEAQREVERNARRQQALIDFGREALGGMPFDQLVGDAVELVREIVETPIVELHDYDRETQAFAARNAVGWSTDVRFDPAKPLIAHMQYAVHTGEAFVCTDLRIEPRARALAEFSEHGVHACVCAPIGTAQEPLGAIVAYSPVPRIFSVGDVRFVESIAQAIAEAFASLESKRRMSQVLESINDAFVAVDRELKITYVNARMATFWGSEPGLMIGLPVANFTRRFEDGDQALAHFQQALDEDRALVFESEFQDRWYETRLSPFSNGVAGYTQDITARKNEQRRVLELNAELERRVAERTKQLEMANKELESFSYSVSHDLRAPLRAIDGFSQALVEDYNERLDERARDYLDRVRKAAQRMADLIDALLKLAKVARASIAWSQVDVSAAAVEIFAELREQEPERIVQTVVAPGLVASGEPHLIAVILQNLIGNAWKFTRDVAGGRIEVGRGAVASEFFVRDNGAGFDMAYSNKLFGAFQRLHSAQEYEGTGIGLATVARIVHRHGGSVRAEGSVGAGATFYFTLPPRADGAA